MSGIKATIDFNIPYVEQVAKKGMNTISARKEMEAFLERKVHLFCQLKVRPNWLDEKDRYSEMGLNFNDGDV